MECIYSILTKLQENRDVNKCEHMMNQNGTDQSEYLFLEVSLKGGRE